MFRIPADSANPSSGQSTQQAVVRPALHDAPLPYQFPSHPYHLPVQYNPGFPGYYDIPRHAPPALTRQYAQPPHPMQQYTHFGTAQGQHAHPQFVPGDLLVPTLDIRQYDRRPSPVPSSHAITQERQRPNPEPRPGGK